MLLRVIQSVILKGEFEGGSRKLASGTSGREMGWQRIKSENSGDSTNTFFSSIRANTLRNLHKYTAQKNGMTAEKNLKT